MNVVCRFKKSTKCFIMADQMVRKESEISRQGTGAGTVPYLASLYLTVTKG